MGYEPFGNTMQATDVWIFGCDGHGSAYPQLTVGSYSNAPGTMNVYVFYLTGRSTDPSGRCGKADVQIDQTTGEIVGATIKMWQEQSNGVDCQSQWTDLVAHEIGHVLGLGDVDHLSNCNGTIMGKDPSFVSSDQCYAVKDTWNTPTEQPPPSDHTGFDNCSDYEYTAPCSPIILNLGNGGYKLTGSDAPVWFDIKGTGTPILIGWTAAGTDAAFLWLDRNQNGTVDGGRELFGTASRLKNGELAPNGFEALLELDSNADSMIDSQDSIWADLRLWRDLNHNGISEPQELSPLAESAVARIDLRYRWVGRRDRYGNAFKFESLIWLNGVAGNVNARPVYDVFFVGVSP